MRIRAELAADELLKQVGGWFVNTMGTETPTRPVSAVLALITGGRGSMAVVVLAVCVAMIHVGVVIV